MAEIFRKYDARSLKDIIRSNRAFVSSLIESGNFFEFQDLWNPAIGKIESVYVLDLIIVNTLSAHRKGAKPLSVKNFNIEVPEQYIDNYYIDLNEVENKSNMSEIVNGATDSNNCIMYDMFVLDYPDQDEENKIEVVKGGIFENYAEDEFFIGYQIRRLISV